MPWCNWPSCWSSAATWRCSRARTPRTRRRRRPRWPRPAPPSSQAHEAYGKAVEALGRRLQDFPVSMPENDPRRAERDAVLATYLDAMLQKGVCRLRAGPDLSGGLRRADEVPERAPSSSSSASTRAIASSGPAWPPRCGRPSASRSRARSAPAIGLYKQLLEHTATPGCAASSATSATSTSSPWPSGSSTPWRPTRPTRWLEKFNRREERRSKEGLGVHAGAGQGHRRPDARDRRAPTAPRPCKRDHRRRRTRSSDTPRRSRTKPSRCSRNTSPAPR